MLLHLGGHLAGAEKRFWREKWLWRVMTVAVIVMAVFFPRSWSVISIVYLAVVSNYALDSHHMDGNWDHPTLGVRTFEDCVIWQLVQEGFYGATTPGWRSVSVPCRS